MTVGNDQRIPHLRLLRRLAFFIPENEISTRVTVYFDFTFNFHFIFSTKNTRTAWSWHNVIIREKDARLNGDRLSFKIRSLY